MRLLNISTLEFRDFPTSDGRPPYAIASHRWGAEEATYKDVQRKQNVAGLGYSKILGFCRLTEQMNAQANVSKRVLSDLGLRNRCGWLWIDTACINKEDTTELSESINSMFRWYGDASVCYAYLADVKPTHKFWSITLDMMRSQWFKRGWTLQELIAPRTVVFVAKNWEVLGHKCTYSEKACGAACSGFGIRLNKMLAQITNIPVNVLALGQPEQLRHISVEQVMSWAERRVTTRTEDRAYCLLGLLDVFITPIYGEGDHAWTRLQQALDFQRSLNPPSSTTRKPKRLGRWLQLKEVKKQVVKTGRYASTTTTTTTEFNGYHPTSEPVERKTVSTTAMGASFGGSPAYGHVSAPMSQPPTSYTFGMTAQYTPMSVPSLRPIRYDAKGPETRHTAFAATPESMQEDLERSSPRLQLARLIGPIPEEWTSAPLDTTLQHHHGSVWSIRNQKGFTPVWYHELPATEATRGLEEDVKVIIGTKVRALFDFVPSEPGELRFKRGDIITRMRSVYRDWDQGFLKGKIGLYPLNYVEELMHPIQTDLSIHSAGQANISTLAAGEVPGLHDWVKHDAGTPGEWSASQWRLVSASIDQLPEDAREAFLDSASIASELTRSTQTPVEYQKLVSGRFTGEAADQSIAKDSGYGQAWQRGDVPSVDWTSESLGQPETGAQLRLGYAYANQQVTTVLPGPSTGGVSAHVEHQTSTAITLSHGAPGGDQSGVHADNFQKDHWRPPDRPPTPRCIANASLNVEKWPLPDRMPVVNREQKIEALASNTPVNTISAAEAEEDANITIPKIILRALLDPRLVTDSTDLTEMASLAGTAVEYIRSLLLSSTNALANSTRTNTLCVTQPHEVN